MNGPSGPTGRPRPRGDQAAGQQDRAALLLALATEVTASLDLQEVLDASLHALRRLFDFGGGAIQLVEEGHLVAAATDPPMAPEARTVRIPVGAGVSGRIASTGEPIYIPDITVDERVHPDGRARGVSSGVRSYFGVPLILGGAPIGVIQLDDSRVDAFGQDVRDLVLAFVPTIAAAVQNARLFDQERAALRNLEEAQRLKDQFLAVVTHELRTPMTTILGFADTLSRRADDLPATAVAAHAARIVTAGRRLQRMLEDLLMAAGFEHAFLDVTVTATDVVEVVRLLATGDPGASTNLVLDVPAQPVWALADAQRLHQVVGNLVDNAASFSPEGQPLELHVRTRDDAVEITVEDRGPGIPDDLGDQVFELFVQGEPFATRLHGGLGIGLYVVHRLCEAMGGAVELMPRPGGGTRAVVTLRPAAPTVDG